MAMWGSLLHDPRFWTAVLCLILFLLFMVERMLADT